MEALPARAPAQVVAAQLRQHQVEDDQIGRVFGEHTVTGLAIGGRQDLIGFELQVVPQTAQDCGVVFDNQYAAHKRCLSVTNLMCDTSRSFSAQTCSRTSSPFGARRRTSRIVNGFLNSLGSS